MKQLIKYIDNKFNVTIQFLKFLFLKIIRFNNPKVSKRIPRTPRPPAPLPGIVNKD